MEVAMTHMVHLALVASLIMLLNITPSWAQTPVCVAPGCNPTVGDGSANTAGGSHALESLVIGPSGAFANTAFGDHALFKNSIGSDNTAVGSSALFNNTTGIHNTAVGWAALESNNGTDNTATGWNALFLNSTGESNTAMGSKALQHNSTGSSNTATGNEALFANTTGNNNTATGHSALVVNSSGGFNTAMGAEALFSNDTGGNNTATGFDSLFNNTIGNNNTAFGVNALFLNTSGSGNNAYGYQALEDNMTGSNNTALGFKALKKSTGTKNIGIGYQAGVTLTTGSNNIYVGNSGAGDESQTIRIGTAQTQTFFAGIGTTPVSGAIVMVDSGTGQLGIGPPSSARYKQDIETMGHRSAGVLQLRPVTFAYREDAQRAKHYGLIAEEVAAVYPELVVRAATGEVQTVKYLELIPMLLNELQHEHQARQQESARVAALETQLAALQALVAAGFGHTVAQDGPGESMR